MYEARSGKLLTTLHPDDAVVPAIQAFARGVAPTATPPSADMIGRAITYQHVLWSPDGKRLALTFSFDITYIGLNLILPDGEPTDLYGALLLDANGAHPHVIMQLESAYVRFGFLGSFEFEWDLQAGAIVAAPASPYPTNTFGVLPPALAYHWQSDGTLAADTPLSTNAPPPAPPLAPVGNPNGGGSFTIWQPGFVSGVAQIGPIGLLTHLTGVYTLNATFAAWSPNGRYLLDAITPEGLLELPGTPRPTQDELNAYGLNNQWLLPLRDAGLLQVLRTVNPDNFAGTAIAWRPDGRALAAYAPENVFAPHPLLIYTCATGRQRALLLPPAAAASAALPGRSILLRWSPDGSHLLLFALAVGQVVVWGPQQLPR